MNANYRGGHRRTHIFAVQVPHIQVRPLKQTAFTSIFSLVRTLPHDMAATDSVLFSVFFCESTFSTNVPLVSV